MEFRRVLFRSARTYHDRGAGRRNAAEASRGIRALGQFMAATVELVMMTQQEDSTTVLQNAWVYWKAGGAVTILRTDAEGHLLSQDQQCVDNETDSEPTKPWIYRTGFQVELYTDVELYYSLGGRSEERRV